MDQKKGREREKGKGGGRKAGKEGRAKEKPP